MKKYFLLILLFTTFLAQYSQGTPSSFCFVMKEKGKIIQREGNCEASYSPCSSFKIALSLMGFDSGILVDSQHPLWPYDGRPVGFEKHAQDQTPQSWITNSCVWYSQILTQKMGMEKFQHYVDMFNYGNKDLSGDAGLNNGLVMSWLSSSLQITPLQQIDFLDNVVARKFRISAEAYDHTREVLYLTTLPNNWKLYGKTGSGRKQDSDGTRTDTNIGWFVGWIQRGNDTKTFACVGEGEGVNGPIVKELAIEKIGKSLD